MGRGYDGSDIEPRIGETGWGGVVAVTFASTYPYHHPRCSQIPKFEGTTIDRIDLWFPF